MNELQNKIMDYMKKTRFCSLTTIGRRSKEPKSTIIFYENSGLDIYFNTGKGAEKVKNSKANPSVALAIHYTDPSAKDIRDTRGLLYSGRAEAVNEKDFDQVPEGVKKVYGMVNQYFPNNAVIFKIKPKKIIFIDYSKGFGYKDVLKF